VSCYVEYFFAYWKETILPEHGADDTMLCLFTEG